MSKNDYIHLFCEAVKIGYFLRDQYLADIHYNKLSVTSFLNKIYDFNDYLTEYFDHRAKKFLDVKSNTLTTDVTYGGILR